MFLKAHLQTQEPHCLMTWEKSKALCRTEPRLKRHYLSADHLLFSSVVGLEKINKYSAGEQVFGAVYRVLSLNTAH